MDKDKLADTLDKIELNHMQKRMVMDRKLVADRKAYRTPDKGGKFISPWSRGEETYHYMDGPLGDTYFWEAAIVMEHLFHIMQTEHTHWCADTMAEILHRFEVHNALVGRAYEHEEMTAGNEQVTLEDMINKGTPPF